MASQVALITGCSSGLGECLAHLLISEDYTVVGIARRIEKLNSLKKETLGEHFHTYKCDVSKYKDVVGVCEDLKAKNIFPNIFFLNAGQAVPEVNGEIDIEMYKKVFDVNYFGTIYFVQQWLPYALKRGATFVATASLAAKQPVPNFAAYSSSKAALVSAFEAFRIQYAHNDKLSFVTALPGPIKTNLFENLGEFKKNTPFISDPMHAAQHIFKKIKARKQSISFPWTYNTMTNIAKFIPVKILNKIFRWRNKKNK